LLEKVCPLSEEELEGSTNPSDFLNMVFMFTSSHDSRYLLFSSYPSVPFFFQSLFQLLFTSISLSLLNLLSLLSSFSYPLYFIYFSATCEEQVRSNGKQDIWDIWNHHTGPIFPNTVLGLHEEWSELQYHESVASAPVAYSLFLFCCSLLFFSSSPLFFSSSFLFSFF
jgi:hypothetical protein